MKNYLPTIGLEIHAELQTASKMFCSCKNDPDEEKPNTNICPICLGQPGTLPVLNREAIRHVLKVGIATGGTIADFTEWDRKNYFYPDIPKGYQISQYKYPLVSGGTLASVEIERIHLEEDTAQSTHDTHEKSLINFNRSGVPLMELVTKAVIHDAATAVTFAKELQLLLRSLGAGEANMEKGEMRVEANISVSPTPGTLGTKTEVKNLNSFKAVEGAITTEIARQITLLEKGDHVVQETRGWDEHAGKTFSQRSKESSHDYRYFPDPDIPKLKISEIPEFSIETLRKELPELPWQKRERFAKDYAMTAKEVALFVDDTASVLGSYFESIISKLPSKNEKSVRLTINYLLTDYLGLLKKQQPENPMSNLNTISPASFAELISLIADNELNSRGAKDTLALLLTSPTESAKSLAEKHDLIQKNNTADIAPRIDKILADHASVVSEYKAGKAAALQFLIGQAMKATKGSANPDVVKKLLIERVG